MSAISILACVFHPIVPEARAPAKTKKKTKSKSLYHLDIAVQVARDDSREGDKFHVSSTKIQQLLLNLLQSVGRGLPEILSGTACGQVLRLNLEATTTRTAGSCRRIQEPCLDESRFLFVVSIGCLSVALLLSNIVFVIKHAWNLGWFGSAIALVLCFFSPDSQMRTDAAKLLGLGVCVTFYVIKCGHRQLFARISLGMPLELLVLLAFVMVQFLVAREDRSRFC